jgi:transposase/predicted O-methyltransferase YrrM
MKRFVEGTDRGQSTLFPECLEDWIDENNSVQVIDVFVDQLDLAELGFDGVAPEVTGRPAYHPSVLLKLYIYGYLNRVQSSRRLEREAGRNVEVMWLTGRLVPDHKTIADFRKDNGGAIRKVCARFIFLCRAVGLFGEVSVAIDGSKFKAVNKRLICKVPLIARPTERPKPAAPMMCGRARFNADEARRQCREELQQLRSGDPLAHHYRASGVHAVNLKNRFRDISSLVRPIRRREGAAVAGDPFYKDHWINIDRDRLDRYQRMFQWNPASSTLYEPADIRLGQIVADFGCGPGHTAIEIAKWVGPGGHVHALDINSDFASQSRKNANAAGVGDRVTAHQCDGSILPLSDESLFNTKLAPQSVLMTIRYAVKAQAQPPLQPQRKRLSQGRVLGRRRAREDGRLLRRGNAASHRARPRARHHGNLNSGRDSMPEGWLSAAGLDAAAMPRVALGEAAGAIIETGAS